MSLTGRYVVRTKAVLVLVFAAAAALVITAGASPAAAHIKSEASQFPDIEATPQAGDIMLLVGLGVIPETPVFEPAQPLDFETLGAWAALAHRPGQTSETADAAALAQRAVEEGLIPPEEQRAGENATYADLNRAIFKGDLTLSEIDASSIPDKADAAAFVVQHLADASSDGGDSLLERLNADFGPTGTVQKVEIEPEGRTVFTIAAADGPVELPFDTHGRVAFGPTDLTQWQGLYVLRSIVIEQQGDRVLNFVQAGDPPQESGEDEANQEPSLPQTQPDTAGEPGNSGEAADDTAGRSSSWVLYGLIALLIVLGFVIFARRRR